MKNAQKPDHRSLNQLLGWLKDGRFAVPDFQREFEWEPWDIRDLVRSIMLDYYIGSLLLWKGKAANFAALSCEPIYGHDGSGNAEYIVLDGQQRLTAMYYAFVGPDVPLPNRWGSASYFIKVNRFMAEEYSEAFTYEWTSKRVAKLLEDRTQQFEDHMFPCRVVGAGGWDLANWVQDYERHWRDKAEKAAASAESELARSAEKHATNARHFGEHLRTTTGEYQISYIELDQELGIDKVCDIFTQLNSKGIRLDVFDLINALLKPKGLQLKHLWRNAEERLRFVETGKMNVYVLQVMSILRQAYCSPNYLYFLLPGNEKPIRNQDGTRRKEVLVKSVEDFEALWKRAVGALDDAITVLRHPQEFGVVSSRYLPYPSILPAFAALRAELDSRPPADHFGGQGKIKQWYWASVFTNRYSGSVESTSARDFLDVRAWFDDDAAEPAVIREFKSRFRELDLRKEAKSGTSIYNGVFNLLVQAGARDWGTGSIPQPDELDDHHIVPSSWGAKSLEPGLVHSILNRTPLSATTNRKVIRDRLPNVYLPELVAKNGREAVLATLATHFISPTAFEILCRKDFSPADFEEFIAERKLTILAAIERLLIKERIELPPNLRALDEQVERIELDLRRLIDDGLGGDPTLLPTQIVPKIAERMQSAERKNPALTSNGGASLAAQLEYCDFRELQDIIINKTVWPRFEPRFQVKEPLIQRFGQLAELRNSLRHSRTVTDVTQKDGDAAISWFTGVLKK
jgi:hypothetical protein